MSERSNISDILRAEALDDNLFERSKQHALEYMDNVLNQRVFPDTPAIDGANIFKEPLQEEHTNPYEIVDFLHKNGSPATVAQTGGRYFGFVTGGANPAALAAKWLSDAWDQNAALYVTSPIASILEEVCESWLSELLKLPAGIAAGYVGGSSTATLCGLTAGRNHLLNKLGYDVSAKGLYGAPEIRVILGEGAHSSIYKALSILGLGNERIIKVPSDEQGRIKVDCVPELDNHTLLILQAGHVNSGAFDSFEMLCNKATKAGAWVHIDGAFGLWAAASNKLCHLTKGMELADSWSVDAHKTLNAPYDNGIILCRNREALTNSLHMTGSYIIYSEHRDGMLYTPDMSRRARIVELWATLKSLGKQGVSELVEDLCNKARYFAEKLELNGFSIHNNVCFNQVLASYKDSSMTEQILKHIQTSGECWCGGAKWHNHSVIRISVCSYRTTYDDIDRSIKAFVRAREAVPKASDSPNP